MNYWSQLKQDQYVDKILKQKRQGYFLDLGACYFNNMNNTYFFEKERDWKGIAIEYDEKFKFGWAENRPNTQFILHDATKIDYEDLLNKSNFPKMIDYLSLDLEPPEITLECLYRVLECTYSFSVITFEVDDFRSSNKNISREILTSKGYTLIKEIYDRHFHVDDLWIHNSIYEEDMLV
jgi:hypothetical protein